MHRVLVTDDVHPVLLEGLREEGYRVDYEPGISLAEVEAKVAPYTGLVINSKIKAYRPLLDAAKNLKFIARLGSGLDIIDLPLAAERGVRVYSAPEGNRNAVAEHALGMLLALFNHLPRADRQVRQGNWQREQNRGRELMGLTVGVIGYGNTGSSFVRKLGGMGVQVQVYDKYRHYYAEGLPWVKEGKMEEVQQKSDVISLHLPLTKETHHLVDERFLAACRDGLILVNTSRGRVVHTPDLMAALRSGKVGGACLDVFENEKPATYSRQEADLYTELYQMENMLLSPHVAGWSVQSKKRIAVILLDKIRRKAVTDGI